MKEKAKATHGAKHLFAKFWESTIFELIVCLEDWLDPCYSLQHTDAEENIPGRKKNGNRTVYHILYSYVLETKKPCR